MMDGRATRSGCSGTGPCCSSTRCTASPRRSRTPCCRAVENGWVTLVAATTENPSFSVISPLLSRRSLVLTLSPSSDDDVAPAHPPGRRRPARARRHGRAGRRGARSTCCASRAATRAAPSRASRRPPARRSTRAGRTSWTSPRWSAPSTRAALRYDRDGDQHYDVISAFIKWMRGSDVDAALHYLARMLEAGEDPRFIARRLISRQRGHRPGRPDRAARRHGGRRGGRAHRPARGRITLAQATIAAGAGAQVQRRHGRDRRGGGDVRAGRRAGPAAPARQPLRPGGRPRARGGYATRTTSPVRGCAAVRADQATGRRYYLPTRHGAEARYADVLDRLRVALGREPAPDAAAPARRRRR